MDRRKIMIIGSTGMLGHQVLYRFINIPNYEVIDVSFRNKLRPETHLCDVRHSRELKEFIVNNRPDILVNCVGVLIQGSKSNRGNAIYINAYLPHFLAECCDSIKAKLIHVSTDCVFSGKKGDYFEDDFKDADDVYGRSKALGEVDSPLHLTLRTSIIGPELKQHGEGLFHWFMNQTGNIQGYSEAFWGGVTTTELAKVIEKTIDQNISGLIHITNGEKINKYDLLNLFKQEFDKDIQIDKVMGKAVDKSLQSSRYDFEYRVPSYADMVAEMNTFMESHKDLYSTYFSQR